MPIRLCAGRVSACSSIAHPIAGRSCRRFSAIPCESSASMPRRRRDSPAARPDAAWQRAAREFEATQRYLADRPEARVALGSFYARQRRFADAETQFRGGVALEPSFVPAYVNFADRFRAQRRDADAEQVLLWVWPTRREATLHHALGLTLVRLGRHGDAVRRFSARRDLHPMTPVSPMSMPSRSSRPRSLPQQWPSWRERWPATRTIASCATR